jgi:hypothetical protein
MTMRHNGHDETRTTTYKDNDLYFENHVTLFGGSGKLIASIYIHSFYCFH